MKLKYFLRGLGTGIIFSAIIMLAAYMTTGGYRMSDEEIIKKAEKLGMVMEDKPIINATETDGEEVIDEEKPVTEENPTQDTSKNDTTEASTEELTENITTEATTTAQETEEGIVVAVESGMTSYNVASLLETEGIIEDASDFDAYLNSNGYSTQIEVGEYVFFNDMTYEEIANMLINGQE